MTDVLETVGTANGVPRKAWSATPEGQAIRERAFAALPDTVPRNRRPRTRMPALVAAVTVVALVAGVVVVSGGRGADEARLPAGAPTLLQLTHGTWTTLRNPILADLPDPVSVWTGRQLLVWSTSADRGVAFDPRSRRWTAIPPSGVVDGQPPVWVDDRMVVWAGATPPEVGSAPAPGAAYDPGRRRWSAISPPPVRPRELDQTLAVGADDALILVGVDLVCPANADCDTYSGYAAEYRPSADTWRLLPRWVQSSALPVWAAWDGRRVVAVSDQQTTWSLELTSDQWTLLDVTPYRYGEVFALRFPKRLVSVGMVVASSRPGDVGGGVNWRALGLAHGASVWSDLGPAFDAVVLGGAAARVGRFVAVIGPPQPGRSAVLDVERERWSALPDPPGPVLARAGGVAWTGREVVALQRRPGPSDRRHDDFFDLAIFTPGR